MIWPFPPHSSENLYNKNLPQDSTQEFWNSFDEELEDWKSGLEEVKVYGALQDPNMRLMKWNKKLHELGILNWKELPSIRDRFRPALNIIISHIFNTFIKPGSSIIELGSNTLDAEGQSYLSSMMPFEYSANLTYSDFTLQLVEEEKKKTKQPYRVIDATKIEKALSKESQEVFASLSVLDVIENQKMIQVAQGAFESLKRGGHFIVLTDRMPYFDSLYGKSASPSNFVTYWLDDSEDELLKGIKIAPKEKVDEAIKKELKFMPEKYKRFFVDFLALTPAQLQKFMSDSFFKYQQKSIFYCLENFLPAASTTCEELSSYFQDLEKTFKGVGFDIKSSQKHRALKLVKSENTDECNEIEYDFGVVTRSVDDKIKPGMEGVYANLHAFVAQKP